MERRIGHHDVQGLSGLWNRTGGRGSPGVIFMDHISHGGGNLDSKELSVALQGLTTSVNTVGGDVTRLFEGLGDIKEKLASMGTRQSTMERDINDLMKVVRDGNGQPSMLHRLAQVEVTQKHYHDEIEELQGHFNSIATARVLSKGQIVSGVIGMAITALLAAASLIVSLFQ